MDQSSSSFKKKFKENYRNKVYGSKYYYSLSDTLFAYDSNAFINTYFAEEGFNTTPSKSKLPALQFDSNKIFAPKNIIRVPPTSPLIEDPNYLGEFKISRIMYKGDRAIVLWFNKRGKAIYIMKKDKGHWTEDYSRGIPLRYEGIELDVIE